MKLKPTEKLDNSSDQHNQFTEQIITTRANKSRKVVTINHSDSKTQQAFKEDVDINNIMKKYQENPDSIARYVRQHGSYADLTQITDLQSAMDQSIQAQQAFDALPSSVRKQYNNDPARFIEAISDPSETENLIKLGVLEVKPEQPAQADTTTRSNATAPATPADSGKQNTSTTDKK